MNRKWSINLTIRIKTVEYRKITLVILASYIGDKTHKLCFKTLISRNLQVCLRTLKTLCYMKEASYKRPHVV